MFVQVQIPEASVFLSIHRDAMNYLCDNPFRFPRPKEIAPSMDDGTGKKVPNVSWDNMIKYTQDRCLQTLLSTVKRNMVETFHEYDGGKQADINSFQCGNRTVHRHVFIGIWDIDCSLVVKNGKLTVADLDSFANDLTDWQNSFTLRINGAVIKPFTQDRSLQVRGNDLHTQRTRK